MTSLRIQPNYYGIHPLQGYKGRLSEALILLKRPSSASVLPLFMEQQRLPLQPDNEGHPPPPDNEGHPASPDNALPPGIDRSNFRLNSSTLFLTYPQCPLEKETAVENLLAFCQSKNVTPTKYVVAQEQHKDGTPHLHIAIWLSGKLNLKSPRSLDAITGKHGHYRGIKYPTRCLKYCLKEDKSPLVFGFDPRYLARLTEESSNSTPKKTTTYATACTVGGKRPSDILLQDPGFYLLHGKKLKELHTDYVMLQRYATIKPFYGIVYTPAPLTEPHGPTKTICEWVNANLFQSRPFRSKQLYIHGPPACGKSTFLRSLASYCKIFNMSIQEDFYDFYSDDMHLVSIDEFKGQKTIQFLNQFLDGQVMCLRQKGNQYLKCKNLPVIICSNYPLEECYKKAATTGYLESLLSRLLIVHIPPTEKIDLDNIHFSEGVDTNGSPMFVEQESQ